MEFLNIGGGEILVIILLAIILFGPEDILRIMRTVGGYVRKIQRMWAQVSAGLRGEFLPDEIIPEEVQEAITDTKIAVDEVKATLNEVQTTVQTDIDDTKATVDEVKESLKDVDTTVKSDLSTIPQSLRETARDAVKKKEDTQPENEPDPESVHLIAALLDNSSGSTSDESADKTGSTTTEDAGSTEESHELATEATETPEVGNLDQESSPIETDSATSPIAEDGTDDEPDPKTVALIASLLEPKIKDDDDKGEVGDDANDVVGDEGETVTIEVETVPEPEEASADTAPEPEPSVTPESSPEVVPEPAEAASIEPSEPVTETPDIEDV